MCLRAPGGRAVQRLLPARRLQQISQFAQIVLAGVADQHVTQPALGKSLQGKGRVDRFWRDVECFTGSLLLKNENRDEVFADLVDQLGTRRLVKVRQAATNQGKSRILQFGQIKCERNLTLKPGLDGVTVRRNYLYGIRISECGNMQIDHFTQQAGASQALAFEVIKGDGHDE